MSVARILGSKESNVDNTFRSLVNANPEELVESTAKALEKVEKSKGKAVVSGFLNEFTGKDYFYHGTNKEFTKFKKTKKAGTIGV